MELNTSVVVAVFTMLVGSIVSLFGWTLSQINRIGGSNAAMNETVKALVARIDTLVLKLDANFSIQINEQVARNVLQEKVKNLEQELRQARRGRRHQQEDEEDS